MKLGAMLARIGQQCLHGFQAPRMRQRTHLHALDQTIADLKRAGAPRETRDELFIDGLVNVEAGGRNTDLARIAKLGRDRQIKHLLDIHIIEHQHRAVSAQFHGRALHAIGRKLGELLAHRYGSGEVHGTDDG